jgi:ethanolamine-phosphate cytidylyltransferase
MPLDERAELISACKWVDEVATKDIPYNPDIELLDKLNCPYVAHGDDLALSADGTDCYSVIKQAGRMKIFKRTQGISTTDVVGRILSLATDQNKTGDSKPSIFNFLLQ